MMSLELILFDYGGVIAPEGFQLGILKLAQKFNMDFEELYKIAGVKAAFKSGYSAGKCDEQEYWKILADELGMKDNLFSLRYVFMDNFQPRQEMIELIEILKTDYKLGVFSDQTNWIYEFDQKYDFFKYFDYKFISYKNGYTKYDDEFYQLPINETGVDPKKILLVDDKQRVLDRAEQFGYRTYLFTSISDCKQFFKNIKID